MPVTDKALADLDLVEVRGWWTFSDGSPATGAVTLTYDGPRVVRDKNQAHHTAAVNRPFVFQIAKTTVTWDDDTQKDVGAVQGRIPALTTDPDVYGAGGTYTCVVSLTGIPSETFSISADQAVPGGVIWLSQMHAARASSAGSPVPAVTYGDFAMLQARVDRLSTGGMTSIKGAPDYPTTVQDTIGKTITGTAVVWDALRRTMTIKAGLDTAGVQSVVKASIAGDALVGVQPTSTGVTLSTGPLQTVLASIQADVAALKSGATNTTGTAPGVGTTPYDLTSEFTTSLATTATGGTVTTGSPSAGTTTTQPPLEGADYSAAFLNAAR